MNATVIGAQMGDEGKGSVVDLFGNGADVVVRYQGGDNAGHTVRRDGDTFELRLLPAGVVRGTTAVLGNGVAVNLETLFEEIDRLRDRGLDPDVRVAARAHAVLPYHRELDAAEERDRGDGEAVGTTGNGIGPTYEDKAGRRGIRVADLRSPGRLRERLEHVVPRKRTIARGVYGEGTDDRFAVEDLYRSLSEYGERLRAEDMVVDAGSYLTERHRAGDAILFEGAQGTHLDVDHGNYPYVTSSNPTAGGAITGTGVPPSVVADGRVVGVVKSYLTRVGNGPMPTEMDPDRARSFREATGEFGTVTGRPRRIGWLDLPMLRHAARVNGFDGVVCNHVDALAGVDELKVCEAYALDGERRATVPATTEEWADCDPVYRSFEPWPDRDWSSVAETGYEALPAGARDYVEYVAGELGCPVYAVSVGPDRDDTIVLADPTDDRGAGTVGKSLAGSAGGHSPVN